MFLETVPEDFKPIFDVVGCYVRSNGEILVLRRSLTKKRQPGLWGFPAGRIDEGEDKHAAMLRELREETGIHALPEQMYFHETIPVRNTADGEGLGYDLWYHVFEVNYGDQRPDVKISDEHIDYRWVTPLEVLNLDYIHDLDACIERHKFLQKKNDPIA